MASERLLWTYPYNGATWTGLRAMSTSYGLAGIFTHNGDNLYTVTNGQEVSQHEALGFILHFQGWVHSTLAAGHSN